MLSQVTVTHRQRERERDGLNADRSHYDRSMLRRFDYAVVRGACCAVEMLTTTNSDKLQLLLMLPLEASSPHEPGKLGVAETEGLRRRSESIHLKLEAHFIYNRLLLRSPSADENAGLRGIKVSACLSLKLHHLLCTHKNSDVVEST